MRLGQRLGSVGKDLGMRLGLGTLVCWRSQAGAPRREQAGGRGAALEGTEGTRLQAMGRPQAQKQELWEVSGQRSGVASLELLCGEQMGLGREGAGAEAWRGLRERRWQHTSGPPEVAGFRTGPCWRPPPESQGEKGGREVPAATFRQKTGIESGLKRAQEAGVGVGVGHGKSEVSQVHVAQPGRGVQPWEWRQLPGGDLWECEGTGMEGSGLRVGEGSQHSPLRGVVLKPCSAEKNSWSHPRGRQHLPCS